VRSRWPARHIVSLMQFIFAPSGRLSDRVGRRPIHPPGAARLVPSYLGFGMAGTLTALFAARILAGIAGANIPTARLLSRPHHAGNRAKGMASSGPPSAWGSSSARPSPGS